MSEEFLARRQTRDRQGRAWPARGWALPALDVIVRQTVLILGLATGFYAGELAMSEKTLSRKLRDKLGASLTDLLHKRKLKEARKLISSGISVADTAFELGFKETSHFSSFYKKYTGASPSQPLSSIA